MRVDTKIAKDRKMGRSAPQGRQGDERPLWADAVEKGLSMSSTRNYRISGADILNRSCAFDADLESILLGDPLKIFFQHHRQKADICE
jgi:hypothetical protein